MLNVFIILFIFSLGLSFGSFINVLEERLYHGEDIFKKPSHCDFCGKKLRWIDMVPILSWVFYFGKSRCCGKSLSWQYPVVEFLTGLGFVMIYAASQGWFFSLTISIGVLPSFSFAFPIVVKISSLNEFSFYYCLSLCFYFVIFILSFAIFIQDLKYQAISDFLLKVLIIVTFAFNLYLFLYNNGLQLNIFDFNSEKYFNFNFKFLVLNFKFFQNIAVAFIFASPFYLIYFFSKESLLGEGDVWIVFWMGLFLGFPKVFWSIYFGIILGGFVSVILLLLKRKKMHATISLGPFLLSGIIISLLIV